MSSKPNISSRIIKKPSFLENIGLKGATKVFFIILLLGILFFIAWLIIKPENIKNPIGLVRVPQDGPLVPVDDSKCGVDIIECGDYTDCVKQCSMTGTNMNYQCITIPSGKEVYYLGTVLPTGKSYCLPNEDSGGGNNNTITSCTTHLGRVVRSLNPDGKLGWVCECKYPSLFGGPRCDQQVACQVETIDQQGRVTINTGPLIRYNDDGTPTQATGATGTKLQYITYQPDSPDNNPEETLPDGSPRWRCYCGDESKTPGAVSLPNDYYSCYQDRCYAGQGAEGSTYFDTTKNECVCNPGVTFKSNVDGFCYPLDQNMMNLCRENPNKGCLCGLEFIIRFGGSNNIPAQYAGIIFKWNGKFYMSQVFKDDGTITTSLNDVGTIKLVEIDPSAYNISNWKYWWIHNYYPADNGISYANIFTSANISGNTITFQNLNTFVPEQTSGMPQNIPLSFAGSFVNPQAIGMPNFAYEIFSQQFVPAVMGLDSLFGTYFMTPSTNTLGFPIYISPVLIPFSQNYNTTIVDLSGSYLEFYLTMLDIVSLKDLSDSEILKFNINWYDSLTIGTYTEDFIITAINNKGADSMSKGLIPRPCNSYYYSRGSDVPMCDDQKFLGDNTVGNSLLNPIGTVCVDFCTLKNPCKVNAKVTRQDGNICNNTNTCKLNPFNGFGYSCTCGSSDINDTSSCFYYKNINGEDFCETKLQDCECCDYDRDDMCQGGKCTNKARDDKGVPTCYINGGDDKYDYARCTSGSDLSRCVPGGNDEACGYDWPKCPDTDPNWCNGPACM